MSSTPAPTVEAAAQQVRERLAHRAAGEDVATDLVERRAYVVRRGERVRPAVPGPVAVAAVTAVAGHRQTP